MSKQSNCWRCERVFCKSSYLSVNGRDCPLYIEKKEDILEDIKVGLGEYYGKIDLSDVFGPKFRIRKFGRIKRPKHKYIPFYFIR